jgi:hypothetical protein
MLDEDEADLDLQSIMKKVKTREMPLRPSDDQAGGLDRSKWTGAVIGKDGKRLDSSVAVKKEEESGEGSTAPASTSEVKVEAEVEEKPSIGGGGGMFKKRKAPNRSARQKA